MNYTIDEKIYTANEGYVFISKNTGIISKVLSLTDPKMIDGYDIIIEPIEEIPQEETEDETGGDI